MDFDWKQTRRNRFLSVILLILVAAVLVVGGYRWRQLRQVAQQVTPDGEVILAPTTQHKYDSLLYKYSGRTLSFAVDELSDRWQWADDPEFPLDSTVVEEICPTLANLRPQQTLTPEESMESYGFTDPVATLTASAGDNTSTVVFGRTTTDGTSRYAMVNSDEEVVYIFDAAILELLAVPIHDMAKLPKLPALTADTLDNLTISGTADTVLSAQRSEGEETATWRSGGANVTDAPEVKALLADLEQLDISKCFIFRPSAEAAEICGFTEETAVVLQAIHHHGGENLQFTLTVGSTALDGTSRYVRLNDTETIYQMDGALLDVLMTLAETGLEG